MPETLEAPAAPTAGGIDSMIAAKFAPPAPAAAPPAPETPPAETPDAPAATPPKPELTPATPAASATPKAKREFTADQIAYWQQQDPKHPGWKIVEYTKAQAQKTEIENKAELARLQARPETPANDARIEQLQKLIDEKDGEIKTWKQKTEEEAFTQGETYQKQFVAPYQSEISRGIADVAGTANTPAMTITETKNGEEVTRPATARDFQRLLKMEPEEWDIETDKFGRGKQRVVARMLRISDIREREQQAREDYSANYEKNKVERELAAKRQEQEYEGHFTEAFKGLSADPDLGSYVSESEADPEGTALLKAELNKFDAFKTEMAKMQPRDRAAAVALVRARFGGTPRLLDALKKAQAKSASLEADIAKLRGTDPGQAVKTVTGGAAPVEAKGIDSMIGAMKWDGK